MADVRPFRGILYDTNRVELGRVLAPPYDVIDEEKRSELAAQDPNNFVRLILPEGNEDKYENARVLLEKWKQDGILKTDGEPALYRYHQVFSHEDLGEGVVTRRGVIAQVRLSPFDEGHILRHERTLKGPKVDRLNLMRTTKTHFSQIFTMYKDPERFTDGLFEDVERTKPTLEATTADGTLHRVWRVTPSSVTVAFCQYLADKNLYIADGHHRYETMLALKEERSQSPDDAYAFGMMFLANIDDPGMVVLPTHRLIHSLSSFSREELVSRCKEAFVHESLPNGRSDAALLRNAIAEASKTAPAFAAAYASTNEVDLFSLKAGLNLADFGLLGHESVTSLDVSILHSVVLEHVLGVSKEAQEEQRNIRYIKDTSDALKRVAAGEGQVCFMMNPTNVNQVRAVSDAGEVMPQKSTFFYPKIASGLVSNPLG